MECSLRILSEILRRFHLRMNRGGKHMLQPVKHFGNTRGACNQLEVAPNPKPNAAPQNFTQAAQ